MAVELEQPVLDRVELVLGSQLPSNWALLYQLKGMLLTDLKAFSPNPKP